MDGGEEPEYNYYDLLRSNALMIEQKTKNIHLHLIPLGFPSYPALLSLKEEAEIELNVGASRISHIIHGFHDTRAMHGRSVPRKPSIERD